MRNISGGREYTFTAKMRHGRNAFALGREASSCGKSRHPERSEGSYPCQLIDHFYEVRADARVEFTPTTAATAPIAASIPAPSTSQCVTIRTSYLSVAL